MSLARLRARDLANSKVAMVLSVTAMRTRAYQHSVDGVREVLTTLAPEVFEDLVHKSAVADRASCRERIHLDGDSDFDREFAHAG